MTETISNMLERRSCRSYREEQIKEDELDQVLLAGHCILGYLSEELPAGKKRKEDYIIKIK